MAEAEGIDARTVDVFERSLFRCVGQWQFLDRFYERFLASSPEVRAKFDGTDFVRQKRALRASLHQLLLVAQDGPRSADKHLRYIAERHGNSQLAIGAHFYDLWLDALLATVKECDPEYGFEVEQAWESVMMIGIRYLCENYHARSGE